MKPCNIPTYLLAILALLASGASSAHAQSVDYGHLEDLFEDPITISATGTPKRVSEAPANMIILTADDIRHSGSRQIPEILAQIPGLNILQSSVNAFDVSVRGYQQPFQPRLQVLIDGRQVFLDDYARTAWENLPVNIDDIRQIEIVKGASSALFGSNANGGVINIITYSPLYDSNNVAALRLGTQDTITGDATTTLKGSWGGSKFTIGGMTGEEFTTPRYTLDQPSGKPRHRYATNSTVFNITPKIKAFTELTISDSTGNTADPTNGALMGREDIATYSIRGGGSWQTSHGLFSLNTYLNHSYISLDEPTAGGAPYVYTTDLIVSQIEDQFKVGADHTFRVGFDYKHKTFKMKGAQLLEPQTPAIAENVYALSGLWQWDITDRWNLSNALRVDHIDMAETGVLMPSSVITYSDYSHALNTWSGNINLLYKATDADTLRAGYGRGVQIPSLINSGYSLFQNFGTTGAPYLSLWEGNPDLKPTVTEDYSLDYTRALPDLFSSLKLGIFYTYNQDIISPLTEIGTVTIGGTAYPYGKSINVGNSWGYGGEIQLKGAHPSGFRWDASYGFTRIIDSPDVVDNVFYQESFPQHIFRLGLGYTTGSWELDGNGMYATSIKMLRSPDGGASEPLVGSGPYMTFNARIGYTITDHLTLAVSGRSLNRGVLATSPYPALERQGFITLTGTF